MIISRTPLRISFFGGGTDYPSWYSKHGGAVLAATIDKYCYLTSRYLPPFFEHRIRVVYSKIENCQSIDEIEHPAVRETLRHLDLDSGIAIQHDGDLPARSGMGTSSAFAVGLLNALYALKGEMRSRQQLATEGIYVEQQLLKETVGCQDQMSTAFGGLNQITFHQDGEIMVRPLTLGAERIGELDSHLMLFYSGVQRTASDVAYSYVQDLESRGKQLHSMMAMVDESISILNTQRDIKEFGKLLHEGWQMKRSLSPIVSNSHVDEIYEAARSNGAIGGKLLGAGGGGFMLLFVPPPDQQKVRETLNKLVHVPFKFESAGSQIIFFDQEPDYSEEHEIRAKQPVEAFRELT
jgi:D-glycero-alpha-D-manno-heptose-7-phosphate kinase